jgi:hypothetical protein
MGLTCINAARANFPYSFTQDVNGDFVPTNINSTNPEIEADYLWVYFTLSAPTFRKKDIYIGGMFNNYSMTPEYKMNYNVQKAFMKSYFGQTRIYKLQIHHSR